jgi:hypothetical protein
MSSRPIYKVVFYNHGKVYEIYARRVCTSDLWGFTCVSELELSPREGTLIDPTEERLRDEFQRTRALHLPMQSIVRIEEVAERGTSAIRDGASGEKIIPLPLPPQRLG